MNSEVFSKISGLHLFITIISAYLRTLIGSLKIPAGMTFCIKISIFASMRTILIFFLMFNAVKPSSRIAIFLFCPNSLWTSLYAHLPEISVSSVTGADAQLISAALSARL